MKLKNIILLLLLFFIFSCSKNTQKILLVAQAEVDCVGESPQKCLQVKQEHQTKWEPFYNDIENFEYEEGFYYKIKVRVSEVEHAPADGPTLKYQLLEILEKSNIPLNLDQGSWLVTQIKNKKHFARNPFIRIDLSKNEINGNTGCNRFSGTINVTEQAVAISGITSTEMMCRVIEVEDAFLNALNKVSSYSLKDGKLHFLDKNEKLLMVCKYLESE